MVDTHCWIACVRATILDNPQSTRYFSLPSFGTGTSDLHITVVAIVHRTGLSTGLCPPGDISRRSWRAERNSTVI